MSCLPHRRYDALQFQSSYSPLVSTTAYSDLDSLRFTPVSGQKPENDMPSFLPTPVASYPSPQLIQCSRILSSGMTSVFASSLRGDSLHPFVLKGRYLVWEICIRRMGINVVCVQIMHFTGIHNPIMHFTGIHIPVFLFTEI